MEEAKSEPIGLLGEVSVPEEQESEGQQSASPRPTMLPKTLAFLAPEADRDQQGITTH